MFMELVWRFVKRELKIRYTGSVLGPLWIVIYPLMFTLVTSVVFSLVFNNMIGGVPYLLYVLLGTIAWVYFSQGLMMATRSLVNNRELISNANFDWSTMVAGGVVVKMFDFLINFLLFGVIFLLMGQKMSWFWLWLPLLLFIQSLILMGLGLIMATLNVYYRDIQSLVEILLQVWYFLTPVVYPISIVPEKYRWILNLNPMTLMLDSYRGVVFGGVIDMGKLGVLMAEGVFLLMIGIIVFKKYKYRFPELV